MTLTNDNVQQFIERVGSADAIPGGGSVSALCGAMAAALARMVARLTTGRKKYAEVEGEMLDVVDTLGPQIEALVLDIDRDSAAYAAVMDAFKLPKETEEEKAARHEAIQAATKSAAIVPLEVARRVNDCLPYIALVALKGNTNAITDACVAAMCARTAIKGALLNVRINLTSIEDEQFRSTVSAEVSELETSANEMEARVLDYATTKYF